MSTAIISQSSPILESIERNCINTIRANSGHPETSTALAPVGYCLWQQFLRFDPSDPLWPNRDRFILDSRYLGHPEYPWTPAVETTTGPLGQGVATSVGIALARHWLAARYDKPGFQLFDFDVYALCGDGCMMDGISGEAASLAGHLRLSNLCWIYDINHLTMEGDTALAFSEDVTARFLAYGWNVARVGDASDLEMLARAFRTFRNTHDRPTLIIVDSHFGYGAALGFDEVRAKRNYGWPGDKSFSVLQSFAKRGRELREAWRLLMDEYMDEYPDLAEELYHIERRQLPEGWDLDLPEFPPNTKGLSTRESSAEVLNAVAKNLPWLIGGSADLAPSTKTPLTLDGAGDSSTGNRAGRNFDFGLREHAMAALLDGMSLANLRPVGSGSLRLGVSMQLPAIHLFTHDSIAGGENGTTHQPIEQLAQLRSIPGVVTLRPCDANEVREAWKVILQLHRPAALVLTSQPAPVLDRTKYAAASGLARGAYIVADPPAGNPEVILIGTGSEVALCVQAYEQLKAQDVRARVVSMPSWELFDAQDRAYRDSVLPRAVAARVSVERASDFGWSKYTGCEGRNICLRGFGASAPAADLLNRFGFTLANVVAAAKEQIARYR